MKKFSAALAYWRDTASLAVPTFVCLSVLLLQETDLQTARGALPIDLEIAVESNVPPGAMQTWARALNQANLGRVRLRGARRNDQPTITTQDYRGTKHYQVVGLLTSQDLLVLPGGKFRLQEQDRLKQFLERLPVTVEHEREERGKFGLTLQQLQRIFAGMSKPLAKEYQGVRADQALARLTTDMPAPLVFPGRLRARLRDARPLSQEINSVTRGTALAALLRRSSLMMIPEHPPGKSLRIRVAELDAKTEHWPVGWKPARTPRETAPKLYQFKTIEIANFTLAEALEGLAPHLQTPVLLDELILSRQKVDPLGRQVALQRGKTYLRRALDGILTQTRLAGEVRVDDAGQPFYWVTQFGPDSPRAIE